MNKPPVKNFTPASTSLKATALRLPATHSSSKVTSTSVGGMSFRTTSGTAMGVPGVRVGKMG
jgi:hypothetical protein